MTLVDTLREDAKNALKSGDSSRAGVLRFLLSEIYNKAKEKQAHGKNPELSDEETIQVLQKEFKRRSEAIGLFKKGGREDLVKKEEGELEIIQKYIPKLFSAAEIEQIIDGAIARVGKNFNAVTQEVMKETRGRADGRSVIELIKKKIG